MPTRRYLIISLLQGTIIAIFYKIVEGYYVLHCLSPQLVPLVEPSTFRDDTLSHFEERIELGNDSIVRFAFL